MGDIQRVEYKGHILFPGGTEGLPTNQGVYAYGMTMTASTYSGTITRYRCGLIVPRPGSTYAEVKAIVFEVAAEGLGQPGSACVTHWDFSPNIVFGVAGDIGGLPEEVTEKVIRKRVSEDKDLG
jgi:hypothetical protein